VRSRPPRVAASPFLQPIPFNPETDPSGFFYFLNLERAAQVRGLKDPTRAARWEWQKRNGTPCPFDRWPIASPPMPPMNPATAHPFRPEDF
jgi:hypothetical protein